MFRSTPLAIALMLGSASSAQAQVVEFVTVLKLQIHEQTDASTVGLIPAALLPYGIDLNVDGADMDLLSPPQVTGPISVSEPFNNMGFLCLNPEDGYWRYGFPNCDDYGTETLAELDSLFGSGTYSFDIEGDTFNLLLTGDSYPSAAPRFVLTGGFWASGVYVVEPGAAITCTFAADHPDWGVFPETAVGLNISGEGVDVGGFALFDPMQPGNLMISVPAGLVEAGQDYGADATFTNASDFSIMSDGMNDTITAAGYEMATDAIIRVPCPSDVNADGGTSPADFTAWLSCFTNPAAQDFCPLADVNGDGSIDPADFTAWLAAFNTPCP